jgi:hypothetical protein
MRALNIAIVCLVSSLIATPALAANPQMHEGPVNSLDDALAILDLSPMNCTPKKGLFGGLDHFGCLAQAEKALEGALPSTRGLRGCFQETKSEFWKAIEGEYKKTHKEAVKAATKHLKNTSSTSSWEILREVTASDAHFVNGCGAEVLKTDHNAALTAMGFGEKADAPCTAVPEKTKPKPTSRSRNRRSKKKAPTATVSKTTPEMLIKLKSKTEACRDASIKTSARYKALEYLLNPAKMDRGSTKANWWHITEMSPGIYSRQGGGGGSAAYSGLPPEVQAKLAKMPVRTRQMVLQQHKKNMAKKGRKVNSTTTSSKAGEKLMKQYQAHSEAGVKEIKTHIEKLVKEVKTYAGGCQAVDAAAFKPTGEAGEFDYSPAYNASRDCAYLLKKLKEANVPTADALVTLPDELSAAVKSGSAPSHATAHVKMVPPMHAHFKAELKALLSTITTDLKTPETTAMLELTEESAVQRGHALLILCEEENVTACFEPLGKDIDSYEIESQQGTCEELLPLWDGEVNLELGSADGLAKALPQGKMPRSGKSKSDIDRQITRLKAKIAQAEKAADREQARAKRKKYQACMKMYSGRFLCDDSPTILCGNRCGQHPMCRCCYYPQAARRRMCK